MFTRSNPLLEKLPHRVRNLILALVIFAALVLVPELRPVLALVLPIAVPIVIGFVAALPVLLPPLLRAGRNSPSALRAEMIGFGALAFLVTLLAGLFWLHLFALFVGMMMANLPQQIFYPLVGLVLGGLALMSATACAAFVTWLTTSAPPEPEAPE